MNEKISIIVPIYNVDKFLNDCIASIINQSYTNLEIILVNDGSIDNSETICKTWEKKDKRIIYINQKNSGVSVARNNGIKNATGNYISFVDGDDTLEPNMIEELYKTILKHKTNVAVCDYYRLNKCQKIEQNYFDKTKVINIKNNKQEILKEIIQFLGVPWGKLYNRNFLINNNLQFKIGLKRMQDTIFTLEAFELCDKIAYLHKPLYNYRIFQDSACNKYSPDFDVTAKTFLHYFYEYLVTSNLWEEYQYLYYTKTLALIIEIFKLKYIPDQCNMTIFQKIKGMKNQIKDFNLDYDMVEKSFYNKKTKFGIFLLKYKFYFLFYIIYKFDYIRKKRKFFK